MVLIGGISLDDVRPRDIHRMLKGSSWGALHFELLGHYAKNKHQLVQIVEALYIQASFFNLDLSNGREVSVGTVCCLVHQLYWFHVLFLFVLELLVLYWVSLVPAVSVVCP